jgi:hypothetical protein
VDNQAIRASRKRLYLAAQVICQFGDDSKRGAKDACFRRRGSRPTSAVSMSRPRGLGACSAHHQQSIWPVHLLMLACFLLCSRCSDSFPSRGPGRGPWLKFGKVASGLRVVIRAAVTNQCRGPNPARRDDARCLQDEVRPVPRCGSRRALEQAPARLRFSCKSTGDVVKKSQARPQKATRSG